MGKYWLSLIGWMFITLGVCCIVLPFLPSETGGQANDTSVPLVLGFLALLALGALIVVRTRRRAD